MTYLPPPQSIEFEENTIPPYNKARDSIQITMPLQKLSPSSFVSHP